MKRLLFPLFLVAILMITVGTGMLYGLAQGLIIGGMLFGVLGISTWTVLSLKVEKSYYS